MRMAMSLDCRYQRPKLAPGDHRRRRFAELVRGRPNGHTNKARQTDLDISDGVLNGTTQPFTIIKVTNQASVAKKDKYKIPAGSGPPVFDVLGNDSGKEGDVLTIVGTDAVESYSSNRFKSLFANSSLSGSRYFS